MIRKGKFKEEVKKIYNSSDKFFISEQSNDIAITDENIVNYIYIDDVTKEVIAYLSVYEKSDFIEMEEFNVSLDNIKSDSVYIWEIGTLKGYEGKGIASKLVKGVLDMYKDRDVYSCVESENIASLKIHEKFGFVPVSTFNDNFFGREKEEYIILHLKR